MVIESMWFGQNENFPEAQETGFVIMLKVGCFVDHPPHRPPYVDSVT